MIGIFLREDKKRIDAELKRRLPLRGVNHFLV